MYVDSFNKQKLPLALTIWQLQLWYLIEASRLIRVAPIGLLDFLMWIVKSFLKLLQIENIIPKILKIQTKEGISSSFFHKLFFPAV